MKNTQLRGSKLNNLVSELSFNPKRRKEIFLEQPVEDQSIILPLLTAHTRHDLVNKLSDDDIVAIIGHIDPDDSTDLLQIVAEGRREKILERLSENLKDTISKLLKFEPNTAAGMMKLDYIQVESDDAISKISEKFIAHEKRTGRPPEILIMEGNKLAGQLPLHRLISAKAGEKAGELTKKIATIDHTAKKSEIIEQFRTHPHNKVVVLDEGENVIGIIYSDDVIKLVQDQKSSLYNFAGVRAEESVVDSANRKFKFRYKWLVINLGTSFLAAFTVGLFENTISKYVLLAVYMPIVAGMGGNAATQTLAVVVRGIAMKQISLKNAFFALKGELGSGFYNGLLNGFLVALIVLLKDNNPMIALILALAMVANLLVAALFGTMVPLIMSALKKDPAASATIFITTATDILGFIVFLGLATILLG